MGNSLNFDNYLFRCSGLGKIMTGVKPSLTENQQKEMERLLENQSLNKITEKQTITLGQLLEKKHAPQELSKSVQTELTRIHREKLFKRKSDLKSKYLDKGIQVEEVSLTAYSNFSKKPFYKNKDFFKNDFICGTPDNTTGLIRDIKSSWDYATFPFYETEIQNDDYICQLNGYMELCRYNEAELIYCLVDTPFKIINDELRRADWKFNIMDNDGNIRKESTELVVELVSNMIYTQKGLIDFCNENPAVSVDWFTDFREVPESLRVKIFKINKDENLINSIYKQITKCRNYLNDLSLNIADQLEVNF